MGTYSKEYKLEPIHLEDDDDEIGGAFGIDDGDGADDDIVGGKKEAGDGIGEDDEEWEGGEDFSMDRGMGEDLGPNDEY